MGSTFVLFISLLSHFNLDVLIIIKLGLKIINNEIDNFFDLNVLIIIKLGLKIINNGIYKFLKKKNHSNGFSFEF